jgi:hypothetical protein
MNQLVREADGLFDFRGNGRISLAISEESTEVILVSFKALHEELLLRIRVPDPYAARNSDAL